MRLPKAADDFYLLSPLDPEKELSDYKCARNTTSWYSCPTCGAKCFLIWGKGSVQDVELPENLLKPAKSGDELEKHDFSSKPLDEGSQKLVKTKAWKIDGRNWDEINGGCYFSINAHTLDPEDGFDLRELVENKWIKYLDCLQYKESKPSFSRPFPGGTY
ncbi:hypothetical protein FQN57_004187 [Myotisia sp. PD_48]|nr:hypothetical protein FQN57_004187 [Myotisia sp. PD_48]